MQLFCLRAKFKNDVLSFVREPRNFYNICKRKNNSFFETGTLLKKEMLCWTIKEIPKCMPCRLFTRNSRMNVIVLLECSKHEQSFSFVVVTLPLLLLLFFRFFLPIQLNCVRNRKKKLQHGQTKQPKRQSSKFKRNECKANAVLWRVCREGKISF